MQNLEVSQWIEFHGGLYPKWAKWYASVQGEAAEVMLECLCEAFEHISLSSAQTASRAMIGGDLKRPYNMEDHVAAIRVYAEQLESRQRAAASVYVPPQTPEDKRECRESYVRDRAAGRGLLDLYARQIGVMPPDDRPITAGELRQQVRRLQAEELSP